MNRSRRLLLTVAAVATMLVGSSLPASADPGDVDDSFADLGLLPATRSARTQRAAITRGPGEVRDRLVVRECQVGGLRFPRNRRDVDGGFGTAGTSSIAVPGATSSPSSTAASTRLDGRSSSDSIVPDHARRCSSPDSPESGEPDTTFSGDGVRTISFARGVVRVRRRVPWRQDLLCGQVYTGALPPPTSSSFVSPAPETLDPDVRVRRRRVYKVPDGFAGDDFGDAIKPVADGRFVLVGGVGSAQGVNTLVMRIHGDGRPDRSFKGDGFHVMNLRKGGLDSGRSTSSATAPSSCWA